MRILFLALSMLSTACVSNSFYARHANHNYKPSDFSGVYLPHQNMNKLQLQVFGTRIVVTDFVADGLAERLKAEYQKPESTRPGVTVEIVRESDEPNLAESTTRFYYLGVGRGPVDLVHYDFDGKHNAFERTDTTLVKNTLAHRKTVLLYDKKDKSKKTSDAGLTIEHEMRLYGKILTLNHRITKLSEPWRSVFPPGELEREGVVSATFIRVEQPRYDAKLRLWQATGHRR